MAITMGATMNITAGKRADPDREAGIGTHRAGAAALLLLALAALVLGAPRLIGAAYEVSGQGAVEALLAGRPVAPADLDAAAANLAAAERWAGGAEYGLDRGLMLMHRGLTAPPAEQPGLFAAAEQATAGALAASPGEPGGWSRLAWLRHQRGDVAGAVAALRLSFLSGAFIPLLMPSRLELALALRPAMDDEMLSLLRRQIRLLWVSSPDLVARLAERQDVGGLVGEALAELSEQEVARYLELHGTKQR